MITLNTIMIRLQAKRLLSLGVFAALMMSLFGTVLRAPQADASFYYGKRTFTVTAYYSPLPGQSFYARGSYEADIRMNGKGIAGASGRAVFPGMIAAPKDYPFGTKIYLEGLGIGTVADRGGAIVNAGSRGQTNDRIDVWMGHGEEGLRRAMRWGVRHISGEVFTNTSLADSITFQDNYTPPVIVNEPTAGPTVAVITAPEVPKEEPQVIVKSAFDASFPGYMGVGANGASVRMLQAALIDLGYYNQAVTGSYDANTMDAVLRFQLDRGIVTDHTEFAAGYFGVTTRRIMVAELEGSGVTLASLKLTAERAPLVEATPVAKTDVAVAAPIAKRPSLHPPVRKVIFEGEAVFATTDTPLDVTLSDYAKIPLSNIEVRSLQKKLRSLGFFDGDFTGILGETTKLALRSLQLQGGLVTQDGTYNQETKQYMESLWGKHVATWGFTNRLSKGDKGEEVKKLQRLLKEQGHFNGVIDGDYDEETEDAVTNFQLTHKVVSSANVYGTGMVGPLTMAQLNEVLFRL